jgi:phosphotransferase system enzyme I (PtsI)
MKAENNGKQGMRHMVGIGVSPGIAIGPVYLLEKKDLKVRRYALVAGEAKDEVRRFRRAVAASASQLRKLKRKLAREVGQQHAYIIDAHLLMLKDRMLINEVADRIRKEGVNAEWALKKAVDRFGGILSNLKDDYLSEKAFDMEDIGNRVLRNLAGESSEGIAGVPSGVIIVARDLSPSETAQMDRERVLGFATDVGGKTSHSAIMARSLEIPATVGLELVTLEAETGDSMILDGTTGQIFINPDDETVAKYRELRERYLRYEVELLKLKDLTAETLDGYRLNLEANIELQDEVPSVLDHGAEGIGLYRTEFIYLNRDDMPGEEEHFLIYRRLAEAMNPRPATIRTFDLGGDKFLSQVPMSKELNPALGLRAIRFCLRESVIFKTQLAGILRASAYGNLKIMFPLISELSELQLAREMLEEVKVELDARGEPYDARLQVGAMIETPAAAIIADILAEEADFFSIGTNDLIQYALAIDRVNEHVAYLYRPFHPAVLRIVRSVIKAAHDRGIPVSMCGEMAGEPMYTLILMGFGIDCLSMNALALPRVKKIIRASRLEDAQEMAGAIESFRSAYDVEEFVKREMRERFPDDITEDGRQVCLI